MVFDMLEKELFHLMVLESQKMIFDPTAYLLFQNHLIIHFYFINQV